MPKPPQRLYALVRSLEEFELADRRIGFQAVDAQWFDSIGVEMREISFATCEAMRVFTIRVSLTQLKKSSPKNPDQISLHEQNVETLESIKTDASPRWFEIVIKSPQSNSGEVATLRIAEELHMRDRNMRLKTIRDVPSNRGAQLREFFSARPEWKKRRRIRDQLPQTILNGEMVVAYDVGHGSAVGIHHASGWVQCYVDFGGGIWPNRATYPTGLKFCFTNRPLIILTHLHRDHWISAKLDKRALACDWLIPDQHFGPVDFKDLLEIPAHGGRVIIWPHPPGKVKAIGGVRIGRCRGDDLNDSGLAVVVQTCAGEILLPGDCGYQELPDFWPARICVKVLSMTVPHHGGATKQSPPAAAIIPAPLCLYDSRLVYSIGLADGVTVRCYGHPRADVEAAHATKWPVALTRKTSHRRTAVGSPTDYGHVLMSKPPSTRLPCHTLGCAVSCDLAPTQ